MRALVQTAPGRLELLEWELPEPGIGQVRIRTHAVGICATDLKMLAGWERTGYPAIPGHEWSGVVDAVGVGVDPGILGKPCVAENVLEDSGEVGFEHPGAYGEFFITEACNLYLLPDECDLNVAILAEPLAVVLRGIRRLRLNEINECLVFGDGPIGLLSLVVLRHFGVKRVFMVGGVPERLAVAGELGATDVYPYRQAGENLAEAVRKAFGTEFPLVIEASGSACAAQASLQLAQHTGLILIIGDYDGARADFEWNILLHRELSLVGSNAGAGAWQEAVSLLIGGQLPLDKLVTHRFPIEQFQEALEMVRNRRDSVIKAALVW